MQPTFQRRVPVPHRSVASFGIAPACDEPCASLHPARFAVRRSAAPSVVCWGAPGMSLARSFELANDRPPTRLWHPCRLPPAIAFELTLVPPLTRGLGRVHRVSVKEPWLVRPEMPSILEKPFSGSASVPRLCRRGPLPGSHFALRGRPLRASRPSAHPAATGFAFGWQLPLADFCSCKEYGHTGERPIPASKRAREWLVSLRPASCPAEREQATRQTEPKPRRRRSAAASTESTSSQRPRCGG